MDILFKDQKLAKICSDRSLLIRKHGQLRAKILSRRLDELRAADDLEVLRSLPQMKCHELRENRAGTLAVSLDYPYRLIFEPVGDPIPMKPDGGLDWVGVTTIRVLSVENYHD